MSPSRALATAWRRPQTSRVCNNQFRRFRADAAGVAMVHWCAGSRLLPLARPRRLGQGHLVTRRRAARCSTAELDDAVDRMVDKCAIPRAGTLARLAL